MIKNNWLELAPGVRACYRNGVVQIECYGIESGIRQTPIDRVNLDGQYFGHDDDANMMIREQLFTNKDGVMVNISLFAPETQADKAEQERNALTEEEVEFFADLELAVASPEEVQRHADILDKIKHQQNKAQPESPYLTIKEELFDSETEIALARGEEPPRSAGEVADMLVQHLEGKPLEDLVKDWAANKHPKLH